MASGEKQLLRNQVRRTLAAVSFTERVEASARIRQHLSAHEPFVKARVLYAYYPLPTEPDWLDGSLPEGKMVAFPRLEGNFLRFHAISSLSDLVPGAHDIREPRPGPNAPPADLILVPGLAFDPSGTRLGRGAGYFDRYLIGQTATRTGIAFATQILRAIPVLAHDQGVHHLITEEGETAVTGGRPSHRD